MTSKKNPNAAAEKVAAVMDATTSRIVDAIAAGIADPEHWRAPWHDADPDAMTPVNAATGNAYTAGNRMALALLAMFDGAATQWGTYNQWQDIGAQVRKGQRAAFIIRPATKKVEDAKTGTETTRIIGWRAHAVFHAGQVDGYDAPVIEHPAPVADLAERDDIAAAFTWAAGIGARVTESPASGASYSPTLDRVQMPDRDRFESGHGCWSTMAHELTHWTGHPDRLAREYGKRFGDDAYAAEELTAELGAAFTLAAIGRSTEPREDHAHYLAHWLRVLKSSPDALWTVASRAEKAAAYLIERQTINPSAAIEPAA